MGRCILKIKDYYLEWSSVVDAPVSAGMKRDDFKKYYRREYGESGMLDFERRMMTADAVGSTWGETAAEVIRGNRAAPHEKSLSLDEIYRAYCLKEKIRNGWSPFDD